MEKERIIKDAHPLIVSLINKYAIGKGEFEDLYQEGVVKIMELLKEFDESRGVNLFHYLKLHLKFFYLNYGRYDRKTVSLNVLINEGIELGELLIDENTDIEAEVIDRLDKQYLKMALLKLSDGDRYIIEQLFIRRKTLDTLAKELKISRTSLFRKKEKVLKKLENILPGSYL